MRYWFERALSAFYLKVLWGERCPEYWADCTVCKKWHEHDEIFKH